MPELPEVETSRRAIERVLKGRRLVEVIPDLDDHIVFDRQKPARVRVALEGARVLGSGRRGKYFWLALDRRPWPVIHLGMSGNVEIRKGNGPFVKAWGGERRWRSSNHGTRGAKAKLEGESAQRFLPFCRFRLIADDSTEVAITDPRRFGRIRLADDPEGEPPISKLGFDPLHDFPSARILAESLARRRAPIKAVLLDQSVFAGVGNWIADEVLFQAHLSPHRPAAQLDATEVARLRSKLLRVIERAVGDRADYGKYPRTWLFHYRWGKEKNATTARKHRIIHDTVGGRTTAWVPDLQK